MAAAFEAPRSELFATVENPLILMAVVKKNSVILASGTERNDA
jgi:hypothetical protein